MSKLPVTPHLKSCPVCGSDKFSTENILWPELIEAWELSREEVAYIDLQQGLFCTGCGNNLRAMTLASAFMKAFCFTGTFHQFCRSHPAVRRLKIVEINSAKNLTPFLRELPGHELRSFPELDLQKMKYQNAAIDVIIHSDTLEHVPDSRAALRESRRVLKEGGHLFYTIPIVLGRLTRSRRDLAPIYHGREDTTSDDYLVRTEYGADFWCEIFEAGFRQIELTTLIFPASMAIHASKE